MGEMLEHFPHVGISIQNKKKLRSLIFSYRKFKKNHVSNFHVLSELGDTTENFFEEISTRLVFQSCKKFTISLWKN